MDIPGNIWGEDGGEGKITSSPVWLAKPSYVL